MIHTVTAETVLPQRRFQTKSPQLLWNLSGRKVITVDRKWSGETGLGVGPRDSAGALRITWRK